MIEQRKADDAMATQRVVALVSSTLGVFPEHRAGAALVERQSMVLTNTVVTRARIDADEHVTDIRRIACSTIGWTVFP